MDEPLPDIPDPDEPGMRDAMMHRYHEQRAEELALEQKLVDVISEAVKGSKLEPPKSVLVNVMVCMTFVDDDGDFCEVWITNASTTTAEGMARRVVRDVEAAHTQTLQR